MGIAMSNIPQARAILRRAMDYVSIDEMRQGIRDALDLMVRRLPAFRVEPEHHPLSPARKREARRMRSQGMSINRIARALGTNHGRVSEAINE
jgi:hypothetical protein